eukprot:Skav217692  [mRNA]  locus=scaffold1925:29859:35237:+ [translate_table: standard]
MHQAQPLNSKTVFLHGVAASLTSKTFGERPIPPSRGHPGAIPGPSGPFLELQEWSFQYYEDTWNDPSISGIMRCTPKEMTGRPAQRAGGYEYQESLNLGPTPLTPDEVDDLLTDLSEEYAASTYHLTHRNCLTFAQHLATSLKVPKEFPPWILGILAASTKVGALDATVDYFWGWAKWYMIRKHEPVEDAVGHWSLVTVSLLGKGEG